jgi:hypothetical protein
MAHRVDPGLRIRVLHPTSRIILTPPNIADGRDVVAALNDPRVYMNLNGPPYPYTDEDYLGWSEVVEEAARTSSEEMRTIRRFSKIAQDAEQNAGGCQRKWMGRSWWVSAIRELRSERSDTGEETKFLGEITVRRSNFLYILDEAERQNKLDENNSLEAGDPKILWEVGCKSNSISFTWCIACSGQSLGCLTSLMPLSLPHSRMSRSWHHAHSPTNIDKRDPHTVL